MKTHSHPTRDRTSNDTPLRRLCPCPRGSPPCQLPDHSSFFSPASISKTLPPLTTEPSSKGRLVISQNTPDHHRRSFRFPPRHHLPSAAPSRRRCVLTNPNNLSVRAIAIPSVLAGKRGLEQCRDHASYGSVAEHPSQVSDPRQRPPPAHTWQRKGSGAGETDVRLGMGVPGCFLHAPGSTCSPSSSGSYKAGCEPL